VSAKDGIKPLITPLTFYMVIHTLLYYSTFRHPFILSLLKYNDVGNDGDSLTGQQAI